MRWFVLAGLWPLIGCGSTWPSGSYADIGQDVNAPVTVVTALTACTANLLPYQSAVHVVDAPQTVGKTFTLLLPEALAQIGLHASDIGQPVHYAVTGLGHDPADGAFIRVVTDQGISAQYVTQDGHKDLHVAGPLMVARP